MTTPTLASVIDRLEAATEGSRGLDAMIARTIGWTTKTDEDDPVYTGQVTTWWIEPGYEHYNDSPPSFTTSLDAAMTLVPRGRDGLFMDAPLTSAAEAVIWINGQRCVGRAATIYLALCIASLRARALPDQPSGRAEVVV